MQIVPTLLRLRFSLILKSYYKYIMGNSKLTIFESVKKILHRIGTFVLYLVGIFWATEAVMKYWSEPARTSIQYSYGDANQNIQFPALTFCALENVHPHVPHYVKILQGISY